MLYKVPTSMYEMMYMYIHSMYTNNIKSKLTIAFCFYITMSFDLFSKNKYSYISTTKHAITKIAF